MQKSTLKKIERWGKIFAHLYNAQELTPIEALMLESMKDSHYDRTIAICRVLQRCKPLSKSALASRLGMSEEMVRQQTLALDAGGFYLYHGAGNFSLNVPPDRVLRRLVDR